MDASRCVRRRSGPLTSAPPATVAVTDFRSPLGSSSRGELRFPGSSRWPEHARKGPDRRDQSMQTGSGWVHERSGSLAAPRGSWGLARCPSLPARTARQIPKTVRDWYLVAKAAATHDTMKNIDLCCDPPLAAIPIEAGVKAAGRPGP